MSSKLPYLNLGCGSTFHSSWTNVDVVASGAGVVRYDLLKGVPVENDSYEVVYHSHVLEHVPKDSARAFIHECYRVLKPGGILRVAIPDLEQIAMNYLKYLQDALDNVPLAAEKYEWTMLEMYDQVVRTKSGGEMLTYLKDPTKGNDAFVLQRNGKELLSMVRNARDVKETDGTATQGFKERIKGRLLQRWLGHDYKALMETAQFRSQGETHHWMYDRYSLKALLESCGFKDVKRQSAFDSAIPGWNSFGLDGQGHEVRKPDSLFMEARK
jgi:predicted SAM-dependent methyltransferase